MPQQGLEPSHSVHRKKLAELTAAAAEARADKERASEVALKPTAAAKRAQDNNNELLKAIEERAVAENARATAAQQKKASGKKQVTFGGKKLNT